MKRKGRGVFIRKGFMLKGLSAKDLDNKKVNKGRAKPSRCGWDIKEKKEEETS